MNGAEILYGVFSKGMNSYLHELPARQLPYPLGSTEREAWLGGWNQTETVSATAIPNSH